LECEKKNFPALDDLALPKYGFAAAVAKARKIHQQLKYRVKH
jgi:hypothetical protein